ncbi:MAG: alpha/beta hydrolase [Agathobacter sp.]|nr:alpha/beta hydrolase [Agathobacter sp.]
MFYNAKEGRLHIGEVSFDYIRFGTGKKTLIMIQGLNTNRIKGAALSLAYMYRIFAREYTVYLFDRRDEVYEGITVKDFALDIAAAMDELGLKNADVFGVSQGGMIAQYLAIERPDLVHKLVLAVTLSRNNDTVTTVVSDWISMTEKGDFKALVLDMAEKMYSDAYVKRYQLLMPLLTLLQKPKNVERFIILAKSCFTCQTYDGLEKITCPVLVIGGKQDKVVSGAASEEMAEKLGCEIYVYEKLGHAAYEEASDFNNRVLKFLKDEKYDNN